MGMHVGPEGFVALGGLDGSVHIWHVPGHDAPCTRVSVLQGHRAPVAGLCCVSSGNFLCSGSKAPENAVRGWVRKRKMDPFELHTPLMYPDYRYTGNSSICCDGQYMVYVRAPIPGNPNHGASMWN